MDVSLVFSLNRIELFRIAFWFLVFVNISYTLCILCLFDPALFLCLKDGLAAQISMYKGYGSEKKKKKDAERIGKASLE